MTTKKPSTTLAITLGMGGVGKTLTSVIVADYLAVKIIKRALYDCDTDNLDSTKGFARWLEGTNSTLDLRNPKHRDRLLTDAAESGAQVVLCDLPANSKGDLAKWLQTVATPHLISAMGLNVVAVCPVVPGQGGADGAVKWITALRDRARYLVVLNRLDHEMYEEPTKEAFADWYDAALPNLVPDVVSADRIRTIEVSNMEKHALEAIKTLRVLPSKALDDKHLSLLHKQRITNWTEVIFPQLDATGLFPAAKEGKEANVPAQA